MNVLVLLSGICDPKWALPPRLDLASLEAHASGHTQASPFDEAALELALKLRDAALEAGEAARVDVLCAGGEALARTAAALRPDSVRRVPADAAPAWDTVARVEDMALRIGALGVPPDLILLGREFGDFDDGSFAPCLAARLGRRFAGLCWAVERADPAARAVRAMRQRGAQAEWVTLALPAVVSATNHTHNRLRHPLLKNVMQAKKQPIEIAAGPAAQVASQVALRSLAAAPPPERAGQCRMLTGGTDAQAQALAALLEEAAP
jgi:electron transfer flavoprotein beta subunit